MGERKKVHRFNDINDSMDIEIAPVEPWLSIFYSIFAGAFGGFDGNFSIHAKLILYSLTSYTLSYQFVIHVSAANANVPFC